MQTQNMSTAALVDAFGQLKAEQSELAKREKAIKAALNKRMVGTDAAEGEMFRVTKSLVTRSTLDTARVKELLANPPVKVSSSVTFRVNARVAEVA